MGELVTIAKADNVSTGTGIVAEVDDKSLAVFNVDGKFFVMDNTCVHRGGPLGEGDLEGDVVTCPWHGWEYNVKTGACTNNPDACVKIYDVTLDGSDIKVTI